MVVQWPALLVFAVISISEGCSGSLVDSLKLRSKRQAVYTSTVIHSQEHETVQGVVRSSVFSQFATHPIHAQLFPHHQPLQQQLLQKQEQLQAGIVLPTPAAAPAPSAASAPPAYLPPSTSFIGSGGDGYHHLQPVQGPISTVLIPPPGGASVAGAYLPPPATAPAPAPAYLPPVPAYSPPPAASYMYLFPVVPATTAKPEPKKEQRPSLSTFAVPPPLADLKTWSPKRYARKNEKVSAPQGFNGGVLSAEAAEVSEERAAAAPAEADTEAPPAAALEGIVGWKQRFAAIRALQDSPADAAEGNVLDSQFPLQYFQSSL